MPSISASKNSTLRTCPRLFYWQDVRFIERARQDGARGFGTLYHKGLEAWWMTAGQGDVPWADLDAPLVAALKGIASESKHVDTDAYDIAKAEAMMTSYHARWAELEYERVGETGVEDFYRVPLLDPDGKEVPGWTQAGKKDAFVKLAKYPRVTPVEHKTTASDITPGSDYIERLTVDGQVTVYIDAANANGYDCTEALYDMSRKPDISPELKTPEEKKEKTIGKGCKECGGSAKPGSVVKGTGIVLLRDPNQLDGEKPDLMIEAPCGECNGSGWKEAPRWKANVREKDEDPTSYKLRVLDKIAENPEIYLRQAMIPRTKEQIQEARADLVGATIEIDAFYDRMRKIAAGVADPRARFAFPRNTNVCLNIYGRRCDFLDVCSGTVSDPALSPLYRIRDKRAAQPSAKP